MQRLSKAHKINVIKIARIFGRLISLAIITPYSLLKAPSLWISTLISPIIADTKIPWIYTNINKLVPSVVINPTFTALKNINACGKGYGDMEKCFWKTDLTPIWESQSRRNYIDVSLCHPYVGVSVVKVADSLGHHIDSGEGRGNIRSVPPFTEGKVVCCQNFYIYL